MNRKNYYYYICEDCGEAIPARIDTIKDFIVPRCRHCTSKRLTKHMVEVRNLDYHKKSLESFYRNSIEKQSLYYGLYELGLSDKEIGDIVGLGSSGVANWRWKRNLPTNFKETNIVNKDGTFKPKNIKGSRDIYTHTRDLLKDWKFDIMKRDKFKCQICGDDKNKEIHHNQETFMDIMKKFLPDRKIEEELNWNEKKAIAKQIAAYHYSNDVSGITLCHSCHIWIHNLNPLYFQ